MKTSLTLSVAVLNKLKRSRDIYKYDTLNNLLQAMNDFFIENGLRPDEKVNYHLSQAIQEIRADFKTRDDSLRKWIGKISHVDLTSLHNDMAFLKSLLTDKLKRELEENITLQIQDHKKDVKEETKLLIAEKEQNVKPISNIEPQLLQSYEQLIYEKDLMIQKFYKVLIEMFKNPQEGNNKEYYYLSIKRSLYNELKDDLDKL